MTRTEARQAAKKLLAAGFRSPTICEDVESRVIYVTALNRCWNARTVTSMDELADLLRRAPGRRRAS